MGAVLIHYPDTAFAVTEHDQVFAEHASLHRVTIRFRHLLNQADRCPMLAHQLPHRRVAFDPAKQIVFFLGHHFVSSSMTHLWPIPAGITLVN
ncbi:hypothetical protein D9M68_486050 [compost metagenome]